MSVKTLFRQIAPAPYRAALMLGTSAQVRRLRALPLGLMAERRLQRAAPLYPIALAGRCGLGAMLSQAVGILAYCQNVGLTPHLEFTNPLYAPSSDSNDWLDQYFCRSGPLLSGYMAHLAGEPCVEAALVEPRTQAASRTLSIEDASKIFHKNIRPSDQVCQEVDAFVQASGLAVDGIGVHFRGTDKHLEVDRVDWAMIARQVEKNDRMGPIFVASDEIGFIQYMRSQFGSRVYDLDCQELSLSGPAHLTPGNKAVKATEALKTMLTLSRCTYLIRTRSHLSAWAKIISPALVVEVLGDLRPNDQSPFPERLITSSKAF